MAAQANKRIIEQPTFAPDTSMGNALLKVADVGTEIAQRVEKANTDREVVTANRLAQEQIEKAKQDLEQNPDIKDEDFQQTIRKTAETILETTGKGISSSSARDMWSERAKSSLLQDADNWGYSQKLKRGADRVQGAHVAAIADLDSKAGDLTIKPEQYAEWVDGERKLIDRNEATNITSHEQAARLRAGLDGLIRKDFTVRWTSNIDALVKDGRIAEAEAVYQSALANSTPKGPETTKLPAAEEEKYQAWIKKIGMTKADGMAMTADGTGLDYDMRGFFKKYGAADVNVAGGQHFTDEFKLPNHATFSNESKYATGDYAKYAGSWGEGDKFNAPAQKFGGASGSKVDAELLQKVRAGLDASKKDFEVVNKGDQYWEQAKGDYGKYLKLTAQEKDPDLRLKLETRGGQKVAQARATKEIEQDNLKEDAWQFVSNGGKFMQWSPSKRAQLDPSRIGSIMAFENARDSETALTGPQLAQKKLASASFSNQLQSREAMPPQVFMADPGTWSPRNFAKYQAMTSDDQVKIDEARRKMREGKGDYAVTNRIEGQLLDLAKTVAPKSWGLNNSVDKRGPMTDKLLGELRGEAARLQEENGGAELTPDQLKRAIARSLKRAGESSDNPFVYWQGYSENLDPNSLMSGVYTAEYQQLYEELKAASGGLEPDLADVEALRKARSAGKQ